MDKIDTDIETLDKEIERLTDYREALDLLNHIFIDLGAYTDALTDRTRERLRRFMRFDDSE